LSTLQSKMAKQKAELKKDVMSNGKKGKKSADAEANADNRINIKLTELKPIDEEKKPIPPPKKEKVKEKEKKKAPPDTNDVKIQVSSFYLVLFVTEQSINGIVFSFSHTFRVL